MTIIVGGRATGKTYRLLQELAKHEDGILITATETRAAHTRDQFIGVLRNQGITEQIARSRAARQIRAGKTHGQLLRSTATPVYVDDVHWVLAHLLGTSPSNIELVTDNATVETAWGLRFDQFPPNPHLSGPPAQFGSGW